jgi:hypothetical protein
MTHASCIAGRIALSLLAGFAVACSDDDMSDPVTYMPGPCDGVWTSAYRACLEEWARTCVGLQCLVASPCSGQAEQALAACCVEAFSTETEYEACLETR